MTTFTIRLEANNLRVARNEVDALNKYLEHMEAAYAVEKDPVKQVAEPKQKAAPAKKKAPPAEKKAPLAEKKAPPAEKKKAGDAHSGEATIIHADVVAKAREAVSKTNDRAAVDTVIKKYGHPISKIDAGKLNDVITELQALIDA